jgi:putative oxidoreductase
MSVPFVASDLLWVLQSILALILAPAALVRAARYEFAKQRMAWVGAVPRPLLVFISVAEVLGAVGLVIPGLIHVAPDLTVAAASGLAVIQVFAFFFHLRRHEPRNAAANLVLMSLLVALALGRSLFAPL